MKFCNISTLSSDQAQRLRVRLHRVCRFSSRLFLAGQRQQDRPRRSLDQIIDQSRLCRTENMMKLREASMIATGRVKMLAHLQSTLKLDKHRNKNKCSALRLLHCNVQDRFLSTMKAKVKRGHPSKNESLQRLKDADLLQIVEVYWGSSWDGAHIYNLARHIIEQQWCKQERCHHINCPCELISLIWFLQWY